MGRYDDEIQRQSRLLSSAAYSVIANGGTVEEARAAFEAGIAEALESQQRQAERDAQQAEYQRNVDRYRSGRHAA